MKALWKRIHKTPSQIHLHVLWKDSSWNQPVAACAYLYWNQMIRSVKDFVNPMTVQTEGKPVCSACIERWQDWLKLTSKPFASDDLTELSAALKSGY